MLRSITCVCVVLMAAGSAYGQTPVVEHLYVPDQGEEFVVEEIDTYVDITPTLKAVTIPAGTAVLTWSLQSTGTQVRLRPFIGDAHPDEGMWTFGTGPRVYGSGSYVVATSGGTMTVGFQVKVYVSPWRLQSQYDSIAWTLVVYPEAAGHVPAVSTWGLAVLGILVLTVGTVLLGRRRQAVAAAIPGAPNIQV